MQIASITSTLAPLAVLACPVGISLMMWVMARRRRSDQQQTSQISPEPPTQPVSLEVLREEHRRLGQEIERLEAAGADGGAADDQDPTRQTQRRDQARRALE
jgi:hypothetical protein